MTVFPLSISNSILSCCSILYLIDLFRPLPRLSPGLPSCFSYGTPVCHVTYSRTTTVVTSLTISVQYFLFYIIHCVCFHLRTLSDFLIPHSIPSCFLTVCLNNNLSVALIPLIFLLRINQIICQNSPYQCSINIKFCLHDLPIRHDWVKLPCALSCLLFLLLLLHFLVKICCLN